MGETCLWYEDGVDTNTWATSCGGYFSLNEGTPSENEMRFCYKCGKPLEESPRTAEEESEEAPHA